MAQNYKGTNAENNTSMGGSNNPVLGKSGSGDGAAQEVAGNLSNDFTLANTKAESKGGDHTVSNQITQAEDSQDHKPLSTAGSGGLGAERHAEIKSHEVEPQLAQDADGQPIQGHGKHVDPVSTN